MCFTDIPVDVLDPLTSFQLLFHRFGDQIREFFFLGLLLNFYFMALEIKYHGLLDDHSNVQLSGPFHSSISYRVPQAEVINDSHRPIFPIFIEILIPILNPFIPVDGLFFPTQPELSSLFIFAYC